ncbi:MAG: hypothetical protein JNM76_02990 [Betaproteobacteria bacterium]|nr:hypothetical protein [Betaproteobacteria bacterium]
MDRRTRLELSNLTARLMMESGVSWLDARAKAARRLGIPPGLASQVDEVDVRDALRAHQSLFLPNEPAQLHHLRAAALHVMKLLADFGPVLVGAIAEGVVTAHTPIELVIIADSEKDVEHRLLSAGVGYEIVSSRGAQAVQFRCAESEPVVLITANIRARRVTSSRRREQAQRLNIQQLEHLLGRTAE